MKNRINKSLNLIILSSCIFLGYKSNMVFASNSNKNSNTNLNIWIDTQGTDYSTKANTVNILLENYEKSYSSGSGKNTKRKVQNELNEIKSIIKNAKNLSKTQINDEIKKINDEITQINGGSLNKFFSRKNKNKNRKNLVIKVLEFKKEVLENKKKALAAAPVVNPAPAPAPAPAPIIVAKNTEEKKKQTKQTKSYYKFILNNHLRSFDNLSSFVSNNSVSNIFSDKASNGSIVRLANNFNSYEDFKAYSVNLDYGYRFNIKDSFVITPLFGFNYTRSEMKDLSLNTYDMTLGGYSLYKFEKGIFSDFIFTYKLSFNNNASDDFGAYKEEKAAHGFNLKFGLIGWNRVVKSLKYGDFSFTTKVSVGYNKIYLNANSVIENSLESADKIYGRLGELDFDVVYLSPEAKFEFNEMFRGKKIAKFVNFVSLDLNFKQDLGSRSSNDKYYNSDMFNNEFLTKMEVGLKTKFGLWYGLSFETTYEKYFAINLNAGFNF